MINAYVLVGYALIWASLLLYAWRLKRRLRNVRSKLGSAPRRADPGDLTRAMTDDSEGTIR